MRNLILSAIIVFILLISISGLAYTSLVTYDLSGKSLNLPKESANIITSPQPATKASLPVRINASFPSGYKVYNKAFLCDGKGLVIYPLSGNSSKSWIEGRLSGTVFLSGKGGQSAFSSVTGKAIFSQNSKTVTAEEFTALAVADPKCQSQKKDFSLRGSFLSMTKDAQEKIHGVYYGNDNILHYLISTGLNNQDIAITGTSVQGVFIKPKIALDSSSNAHIVWGYNSKLFYTYFSGSWLTQEINITGNAIAASIGVDSSNSVHVIYSIDNPQRIVHSIYASGLQKDSKIIFEESPSDIEISKDKLGQLYAFWAKEKKIIQYSISDRQRLEYESKYEVKNPYATFDSSNILYVSYEGWAASTSSNASSNATSNASLRLQSIGVLINGMDYGVLALDSLRSSIYPKISADTKGYVYLAWSKGSSVYVMGYDGVQWSPQQTLATDASIINNFASSVQGNIISVLYEKSSGLAIANMPLSCFTINYTQAASGRAYNPEVFSGCSRNLYLFGCKLEPSMRWNCTWYYSPIEFMAFDDSSSLIRDSDLKPQTTYYFIQEYDPNTLYNEYFKTCKEGNATKPGCNFGSNIDLFKVYDPKAENVVSSSKAFSPEVKVAECGSSISKAELKINDKTIYSYGNQPNRLTGAFSVAESSLIKDLFEGLPASEYRIENLNANSFTLKSDTESLSYGIPKEKNISEGIIEVSLSGLRSDAYICGSGYANDWSGSDILGENGVKSGCKGSEKLAELFSIGVGNKDFISVGLSGYAFIKIFSGSSSLAYAQGNINNAPVYNSYPVILSPNKEYRFRLKFGKGEANLNIFDGEEKILDITSYYSSDYSPYITSIRLGSTEYNTDSLSFGFSPKGATYSQVLLYQLDSNVTSQSEQCIQVLKPSSSITCAAAESSFKQNFFNDFGIEGVSGGIGSFSADMNKGYSFETGRPICNNLLLTGQNNLAVKVTDAGNNSILKSAHFVMKPRGSAKFWEVFSQDYLAGYPKIEFVNKRDITALTKEGKLVKFVPDSETIDLSLFDQTKIDSYLCYTKTTESLCRQSSDLCTWGLTSSDTASCSPRISIDKGAYHLVTYVYSSSEKLVENLAVSGSVGFALFCNGILAAGTNVREVEISEPNILKLREGWNRFDLLIYRDLPYYRQIKISPAISSLGEIMNPRIYPETFSVNDLSSYPLDLSWAKGEIRGGGTLTTDRADTQKAKQLNFQSFDCESCLSPDEGFGYWQWYANPSLRDSNIASALYLYGQVNVNISEFDRCYSPRAPVVIPNCYYLEAKSKITRNILPSDYQEYSAEIPVTYSFEFDPKIPQELAPNIYGLSCDRYDKPVQPFTLVVADNGEKELYIIENAGEENGPGCPVDYYPNGVNLADWKTKGAKCIKFFTGFVRYNSRHTAFIANDYISTEYSMYNYIVEGQPQSSAQIGEMTGGCIKIPE